MSLYKDVSVTTTEYLMVTEGKVQALLQAWCCWQPVWFSLVHVQEGASQLDGSCLRDPWDILLACSSLEEMMIH